MREVTVYRNDEFELSELEKFDKIFAFTRTRNSRWSGIVEAGLSKNMRPQKASWGCCLGLQAIGEVFGGNLINLEKVYHGVATKVNKVSDDFIFNEIPNEMEVRALSFFECQYWKFSWSFRDYFGWWKRASDVFET